MEWTEPSGWRILSGKLTKVFVKLKLEH